MIDGSRILKAQKEVNRIEREALDEVYDGPTRCGMGDGLGSSDFIAKSTLPPTALFPTGSAERKRIPVGSGVLDYFPAALKAIAEVSYAGNEQHNPGEPLHWARGKSMDQADTMIRHYMERGTFDTDGLRHSAKMAWRALAILQLECEESGYPMARGASDDSPKELYEKPTVDAGDADDERNTSGC